MSLKWRIAIGLGVIAAVVATVAASGAYLTTSARVREELDRTLRDRVAALVNSRRTRFDRERDRPGPGGRPGSYGLSPCLQVGSIPGADVVQLILPSGEVVRCSEAGPIPTDAVDLRIAEGEGVEQFRTVETDDTDWRVLTTALPTGGALQTARNLDESQRVLAGLGLRLLGICLAAIAAAVALGILFARRIVEPVERLRDAARRIAETQDLETPVPVGGDGEVRSLADSFTTMVRALAASRAQQQQLITDASHELRTPLTSLRTNVELLQRAASLPDDQRTAVLDDIRFETEELTSMMTELVELTSERPDRQTDVAAVDLAALAEEVAGRAARRSGRPVTVVVDDARPVHADGSQIERVIANLVDNALKYSPAGTAVEVQVRGTSVVVADRGDGIADVDRGRIFDRFYRADSARTAPGSGLGLAIVDRIVREHGGTVTAANGPDGGACVGFTLPPASSAGAPVTQG